MQTTKKLMKSRNDKVIDGVCGGLGEYFGIDPVLIRLAFVVGLIAHLGSAGILYIVLMIIMPESDQPAAFGGPFATTGAGSGASGSTSDPSAATGMPGAVALEGGSPASTAAGDEPLDARLQDAARRIDAQLQTAGANIDRAMASDPGRGQRWAAAILILLGVYFLLGQFRLIPDFDLGRLWPLILILIGVQMLRRRAQG